MNILLDSHIQERWYCVSRIVEAGIFRLRDRILYIRSFLDKSIRLVRDVYLSIRVPNASAPAFHYPYAN